MLPPRAISTMLGTLLLTGVLALGAPTAGAPTSASSPTDDGLRPVAALQRAAARAVPPLYADPYGSAAGQEARFDRLARTPQAVWLTSGIPTSQVGAAARDYLDRARRVRRTGQIVVYAIPNRDCGGHSSGGLPDGASYKAWIRALAAGVRGRRPLVVLEPDAIAFAGTPACGDPTRRVALLRYAVTALTRAGAWVYLDAGHSAWTPYAGRARLLRQAGVGMARGFSTNVSNFRTTASEKAYAGRLIGNLRALGVRGVHYVVDTSRNGARRPVTGDVFNPTWARLGAAPRLLLDGAFDGRLWVKRPGESDGPVNGGPAAGQWCDSLADRLMGRRATVAC